MYAEQIVSLNPLESELLRQCEDKLSLRDVNTFIEVGNALKTIRDKRLYRAGFKTFEDYCRTKWGMSKTHADRLITAFQVAETLTPIGVTPFEHESHIRALNTFPSEHHETIAKAADSTAKSLNKPLTAGMITRIGEVMMQAITTGAVDVDGEATPLTAALSQTEYEAVMRQTEHIREAVAVKRKETLSEIETAFDGKALTGYVVVDAELFLRLVAYAIRR